MTKRLSISERRMERWLQNILERHLANKGGSVRTFQEAMVLTSNKGLIVQLGNDQEFQLSIVESTRR